MRASDYDFELPAERIAQAPAARRDEARLYVLPRRGGDAEHRTVAELAALIPPGALLVLNDTRVIPARLRGRKSTGGRVELLLLHPTAARPTPAAREAWAETWTCLAGASKAIRPGMLVELDGARAPRAEVLEVRGAEADVRFTGDEPGGLLAAAERIGEVPLPPYIARSGPPDAVDRERYQTVYARVPGAVAAPTAGLHLTPALLDALAARGVERAFVTLHVGAGTFAPLRTDDVEAVSELHVERYDIPETTARAVTRAHAEGRPVVAVGTTTVRALESAAITARVSGAPVAARDRMATIAADRTATREHPVTASATAATGAAGRAATVAATAENAATADRASCAATVAATAEHVATADSAIGAAAVAATAEHAAPGDPAERAATGDPARALLVRPGPGETRLFIRPGHHFRVVDALLTNFHLPRSTLLLLVAAFVGDRERLLGAYRDAVARGYRFYSYGDAMWIA